ncbi:MAG TPA: hypothetical protein VGE15_09055 [Sphingobacteriaceae bacterium]
MKYRSAFLAAFLVLLLPGWALACSCSPIKDIKSTEDLKRFDFIALAEVTGLAPVKDSLPPFPTREDGSVRITVLELFKGKPVAMLDEPSVNTSCDLGLRTGQQWLFFGWKDASGKIMIGPCNYSVMYRSSTGLRDWQVFTGMQQLVLLRTLFNKPVQAGPERILRYANGMTEAEQNFRHGKLHGIRKIYYPTGELYVAEKFSRGRRKGYRKVFGKCGQLFQHTTYAGGHKRQWVFYFDPLHMDGLLAFEARRMLRKAGTAPDEISIKRVADSLRARVHLDPVYEKREFDRDWRSYHFRTYFLGGRIREETQVNWKDKVYSQKVYDEAGKLDYITILDGKAGTKIYEQFDSKGSARKSVEKYEGYVSYFDPALSDAWPEPIIIY